MKRRIRHTAAVLATAALLCSGASAAVAESAPDRPAVQQAMEELAKSGAAGVQVRMADGQGEWTGRAGVAKISEPPPVPQDGRFRVGSISKTMLSAVVLQLVDEGKVVLDRPIAEYLPEFGLDQRITVRMLLQHTSGIFNYTGDTNADGSFEPGIPLSGQEYVDKRFHVYQPGELVRLALSKPARFEPGTQWRYSNTNYVLAGLLVEKITGNPYGQELRARVFDPLGMRDTTVPGTKTDLPGPHAHGYFAFPHGEGLKVVDITRLSPTWAYGAGEVISTTEDLDRFISALLDGKLMSPASFEEMLKMRPAGQNQSYGLGLMKMDVGSCGELLGHTGGIPGYYSYLFSTPDQTRRIEISVNSGVTDLEDPESAARFQRAAEKVVVSGLCGQQGASAQQHSMFVPFG